MPVEVWVWRQEWECCESLWWGCGLRWCPAGRCRGRWDCVPVNRLGCVWKRYAKVEGRKVRCQPDGGPAEVEAGMCGVAAGAEGLVEWVVTCEVPVEEEVAAAER